MNEPTYRLQHIIHDRDSESEDFSGPLDLILRLLIKNKIEIRDIQISEILEQFLAYLEEMKRMDLEIASSFITMASRLTLIKTKMLLSEADQQEGRSEMELLIQSLEQRQQQEILEKIKISAALLAERSMFGSCLFIRTPEPITKDSTYCYLHAPNDLQRALLNLQERCVPLLPSSEKIFVGIIGSEPYPVEKKTAEILKNLIAHGTQQLRILLSESHTKSELIAAFLSILELCRIHSIQLTDADDDISVYYIRMPEEIEADV